MEQEPYRTWEDFKKEQYRRCNTFQLSIDELAKDLYYDDKPEVDEEEVQELNFDM